MKKNIKYILTICSVFLLISCSKNFLEIEPEQDLASEIVVVDLPTLQTSVTGVYNLLQDNGYYGRNLYIIPELMADNLYLSLRNTGRYLDYNNFVVSKEDSYANSSWNSIYKVAVNATRAVVGGEKILAKLPGKEADIKQLIGEAYALRALAHFDLVRLFAQPYNYTADASHLGIPLITQVNEDPIAPARNTVKEVFKAISEDLDKAIANMTKDYKKGRFSKYAAFALAARAALYQDDYDKAISYTTEVINKTGLFKLITNSNYKDLWSTDFNPETMMEIVNTIDDNAGTNSLGHFFDVTGYADALVTQSLIDTYAAGDVRMEAVKEGSKPSAEKHAYFVNKFPRGTKYDDNIKILRLAEMYLIRAEAYAKTDQDGLAQQDLEIIVTRADPAAAGSVTETGSALLDRIILERRKELAFEGHRLFDLNRNKKNVDIDQGDGNVIHATYPNNRFILPIPLDEINANPNIKPQQNPGY